ncbi:hypothetical protein HII17_02265 [Thalassotalea sp. M1531]|uniref:Uncharacterized protein n=1 Tax=Thalassotalea algicola TaxID=2716224 RepID=A0A7Y0L9Z1_9GAMM|nr:hypothetical protein [Thalassotalea algicola]NMP30374.1 hypothetical protein [Thalassotalea algicola]
MKTLTGILAMVGVLVSTNVFAQNNGNVEAVAAALIKQQNSVVSQAVDHQVNQDIHFALRAMKMPKITLDQTMIAKAQEEKVKKQDSE